MVDKFSVKRLDGPSRRSVPDSQKADGVIDLKAMAQPPESAFTYQRPGAKKTRPIRRKLVASLAVFTALAVIGFGLTAVMASHKVITKNSGSGAPALAGDINPTKLKGEGDGRINILLLGIGGVGHEAPNLSDTMIVASIDPRTKDVAMLSIPRDFYVKIPGYWSSKINAAYAWGEKKKAGEGGEVAKATVSEVMDVPIHYYVRVDFAAFKQAVDAVGGIDITVDKAINDPEYPCDNGRGVCPYRLAAGKYHMDGVQALKYSRSRKGSAGGDFDRAARQQKVLVALRQKALNLSTLSNPIKMLNLIDTAGNHIKTDLQPNELKKLGTLVKDMRTNRITQKVLDTSPEGLLKLGNIPGAGSIVVPKAGLYEYTGIRELVHSIFVDNYLKEEAAKIELQNGTTKPAFAATVAKILTGYNYKVVATLTAPTQNYPKSVIYDYTGGKKPYTVKYLEKRFGAKVQRKSYEPPAGTTTPAPDIAVIIGSNYQPNTHSR
ncbi:MAG TPA: LCP family protein [Candidatus Dormibacteraeota bacterium]|nr:LCP family protein [Candidatus Dormibacteraeota bacterium]